MTAPTANIFAVVRQATSASETKTTEPEPPAPSLLPPAAPAAGAAPEFDSAPAIPRLPDLVPSATKPPVAPAPEQVALKPASLLALVRNATIPPTAKTPESIVPPEPAPALLPPSVPPSGTAPAFDSAPAIPRLPDLAASATKPPVAPAPEQVSTKPTNLLELVRNGTLANTTRPPVEPSSPAPLPPTIGTGGNVVRTPDALNRAIGESIEDSATPTIGAPATRPPVAPTLGEGGNVSNRLPNLFSILRGTGAGTGTEPESTLNTRPAQPGMAPLPPTLGAGGNVVRTSDALSLAVTRPGLEPPRIAPPAPAPILDAETPPAAPGTAPGFTVSDRPPELLGLTLAAGLQPPAGDAANRTESLLPPAPSTASALPDIAARPPVIGTAAAKPVAEPERHYPVRPEAPARRSAWRRMLSAAERVAAPRVEPHHPYAHLTARTRADERFSRILTITGAVIILPAVILGWRYLVPDDTQMLDRLVADGKLKEAALLANKMAGDGKHKGGPDYRFLATAMLVENAVFEKGPERKLAFARTLEFARANPADPYHATAVLSAMRKLGVSEGATEHFEHHCGAMPTHLVTLWVEGLVDQFLSENRPADALHIAIVGWDASPGQAVTPEYLLKVARLAGKPEAIAPRIRQFVVVGGRFDKSDVYRAVARESGKEEEALRTLWPFIMMRLQPGDYPELTASIMACGSTSLPKETASLVETALKTDDLPFDSGTALIRLCLSRNRLDSANEFVDKLAARRCETPEFLRLAAKCKLWTNKPALALEFYKKSYFRTGDAGDFREAVSLSKALESTRDLVALCEHRGEAKLTVEDLPAYAIALTGMGEYESALRVYKTLRASGNSEPTTLLSIARLQRALRLTRDALATYGDLVALEPKNPIWRDQQFRLLITLSRDAEAIAAAERNWHDLRDPRYLGEALRTAVAAEDETSILRIALEARTAARTADPVHLLEACYHLQLAKKEEPRIAILSVLGERFPERLDIGMELLVHDFNRGRFDEVERRFQKQPALAAGHEGASLRLSARLAEDDRDAARSLLDDALDRHLVWLDHEDFAEVATQAAIHLKHLAAAETISGRFLQRDSGGPTRFRVLATRLLTIQGKAEEAIPLYRSLGDALSPEMRIDYAWALAGTGNFAEAEIQMLRAISETPKPDPKLFGALGDLRLSSGSPEKAREAYRNALILLEKKP